MMFGMGQEGTTNLITRALSAVGKSLDTVPDPTQIHYHLPPSVAHPEASLEAPPRCKCRFPLHLQSNAVMEQTSPLPATFVIHFAVTKQKEASASTA